MLTLTCDRCGLTVELIHHLYPKAEDVPNDEPHRYWGISWEQSGIWDRTTFDSNPQEFDDMHSDNGWMKYNYGEWNLNAHLCKKCKEEYRQYIKDYSNKTVELDQMMSEQALEGFDKLKLTMKEIKERLDKDRQKYKDQFLIHKNMKQADNKEDVHSME